jgi:hypothetical protein
MIAGLIALMAAAQKIRLKFRFGLIEFSILCVFLMIAQAFIRNPAGLAALGSENVGGRANFEMAIAAILFITIAPQVVSPQWIRRSVWLYVLAQIAATGVDIATNLVPAAGFVIYAFYRPSFSGGLSEALAGGPEETSLGRLPFFQDCARVLGQFLVSINTPLQLANPFKLRFLALLSVAAMTLATGFRSLVAILLLSMVVTSLFRKRFQELFIVGLAAIILYAFLAVGNGTFFNLPLPAQRALSALPGNWDDMAALDGESSSDWRFEMWRQALGTDKYIKNKLLGDGYAISSDVYIYQEKISAGQKISPEALQEYYLLIGGYHSGPVETVRRIGYLGLIVLLACQLILFRESARTIRLSRGTELFPYTLFITLPLTAGFFVFWFIVGGFHTQIIAICFSAAWLRMIQNSSIAHVPAASASPAPVSDMARGHRRLTGS